MCIQVENIGMRTARIEGFGWTTGYANVWRFLPKALRLRSVHQLPDYEWAINKNFPWTLEPGESQSTFMRREEFFAGMAEPRSEEHTSELQSLMRLSYAFFCLKIKNSQIRTGPTTNPLTYALR